MCLTELVLRATNSSGMVGSRPIGGVGGFLRLLVSFFIDHLTNKEKKGRNKEGERREREGEEGERERGEEGE